MKTSPSLPSCGIRVVARPACRLLMLATFLVAACGLAADSATPVVSRARAQARYERARPLYEEYEKNHGGYVQTRNVRLHYLSWGDPGGVPLIWAHGTNSSAYEMAPFAAQLVAAGYRVVAIDYYGHGRTPIPPHEVSLWHVADDIAALMDTLRLPRAVIGGWSRGGAVSAAFYDAYPGRTLGLILEDGGSFSFVRSYDRMSDQEVEKRLSGAPWIPQQSFGTELDAFEAATQLKALAPDRDEPLWNFVALGRISRDEVGGWKINRGLATWLEEHTSASVIRMVRRPSVSTLFQQSSFMLEPRTVFRNLAEPLLIIDPVSTDDAFPAGAMNEQLQRAHPALVFHQVYPDTSHAAKFERPEWFIRDATALLQAVKDRTKR